MCNVQLLKQFIAAQNLQSSEPSIHPCLTGDNHLSVENLPEMETQSKDSSGLDKQVKDELHGNDPVFSAILLTSIFMLSQEN